MTPEGWRRIPLEDLLLLETPGFWGDTPRDAGGVRVLRSTNLRNSGVLDFSDIAVRSFPTPKLEQKCLKLGDILLERSGGGPKQPVGRVALFRSDGQYSASNFIQILRPDPSACAPEYLLYELWRFHATGGTESLQQATTGIRNLQYRDYLCRRLLLPPLPEQRKIAAILSSVDEAIEGTQAAIDQLQVVKKAMMADLLTRGIPGRHQTFKQTEIGEIPAEWDVRHLAEVVAPETVITYGIVQAGPHVKDGVPYIKTGDVKPEGIDPSRLARTSPEIAARFERSRVRTGDLVFCIRASVGAVARVSPEIDGANLTQGTARIAPGPAVDGGYLLWALRSAAVQRWVDLQCKGSTFREITLAKLRELPVPIPSDTEQVAISSSLAAVESRIHAEHASQRALSFLKSALMSVLLTGEVRVKVDEESAA